MESLKELIAVIKTGAPAEVKAAQKQAERLYNKVCRNAELEKVFAVFLEEAFVLEKTADVEHQVYFINTLKWPFFAARPETFIFWIDLLLSWVVRPEGKIRLAAVRAAQYLVVNIVFMFDEPDGVGRPKESPENINLAKACFCGFALKVAQLTETHMEPRFKRHKFIDSLPAGVYKSLQQLMWESILTCDRLEKIYTDFLAEAQKKAAQHTTFGRA